MTMQIIKDEEINEGAEAIGSVQTYVKKAFKSEGNSKNEDSGPSLDNTVLATTCPPEWKEDTQKEVLIYYYSRYGSGAGDDFEKVSGNIAKAINRSFGLTKINKEVSSSTIITLLQGIDKKEFVTKEVTQVRVKNKEITQVKKKIDIQILEGAYEYIKSLEPLTEDQLELVGFVEKEGVCFSSSENGFHLSLNPNMASSFEELLKFNDQEKFAFEIFKTHLKDDKQAQKMVLLNRLTTQKVSSPINNSKPKRKKGAE